MISYPMNKLGLMFVNSKQIFLTGLSNTESTFQMIQSSTLGRSLMKHGKILLDISIY
ncbi:hypothetical protein ACHAXR_000786 [Thalassiosira sp. AJA248-18]